MDTDKQWSWEGDPLSMIIYLYYHANLLDIAASKNQDAMNFVDDVNIYAEGNTFEEAYDSLRDMLLKINGAEDKVCWSVLLKDKSP